jgi:hypothetical protein
VAGGSANPTARVEYALRADEFLTEPQVRQIMEYYLAVRMRRFGRTFQPGDSADRTGERGREQPERSALRATSVGSAPARIGPTSSLVRSTSSSTVRIVSFAPLDRSGRRIQER